MKDQMYDIQCLYWFNCTRWGVTGFKKSTASDIAFLYVFAVLLEFFWNQRYFNRSFRNKWISGEELLLQVAILHVFTRNLRRLFILQIYRSFENIFPFWEKPNNETNGKNVTDANSWMSWNKYFQSRTIARIFKRIVIRNSCIKRYQNIKWSKQSKNEAWKTYI